jgi:hypothetical protein
MVLGFVGSFVSIGYGIMALSVLLSDPVTDRGGSITPSNA